MKKTVTYATFCCAKDLERTAIHFKEHVDSHKFAFDEKIMVLQRCDSVRFWNEFKCIEIKDDDYPKILGKFGIKYPDPILDHLTHGWSAPHFWAHHVVNHLAAASVAQSDYIVFSDADCYMRDQPESFNWVEEGIHLLETDSSMFVVSPNDGRPNGGQERIMSQQMFLVDRSKFLSMEMIPWDGIFMEGGPFQEYYGLLEGRIDRYMRKNSLYRYVLGPVFRYWHKEWH